MTDVEAAAVLESVRKRADSWRTGTAGVLGLITAALVVTDVENSVRIFDPTTRDRLAGALVLAAILGLVSLWFVIRAANGPSWLDTRVQDAVVARAAERDLRRARAAASDLRMGQVLLTCAVLVFIGLVAATWVLPEGQQ